MVWPDPSIAWNTHLIALLRIRQERGVHAASTFDAANGSSAKWYRVDVERRSGVNAGLRPLRTEIPQTEAFRAWTFTEIRKIDSAPQANGYRVACL